MIVSKTEAYIPDFFERTKRAEPETLGVPDFEAAIILATVAQNEGMLKNELVKRILGRLGRPESENQVFLRFLDRLRDLQQVTRHSFGYYLTPAGQFRLKQLKNGLMSAMNLLQSVY